MFPPSFFFPLLISGCRCIYITWFRYILASFWSPWWFSRHFKMWNFNAFLETIMPIVRNLFKIFHQFCIVLAMCFYLAVKKVKILSICDAISIYHLSEKKKKSKMTVEVGSSLTFRSSYYCLCKNLAHKVLPGGDGIIIDVTMSTKQKVVKIPLGNTYSTYKVRNISAECNKLNWANNKFHMPDKVSVSSIVYFPRYSNFFI
jgi:hypothetical protein